MKLKWVKGHNGQRRKLARAVAHLEKMYHGGDGFDSLWSWWERYEPIACLFKYEQMQGAELVDKAWEILGEVGESEYISELRDEYWASVL